MKVRTLIGTTFTVCNVFWYIIINTLPGGVRNLDLRLHLSEKEKKRREKKQPKKYNKNIIPIPYILAMV